MNDLFFPSPKDELQHIAVRAQSHCLSARFEHATALLSSAQSGERIAGIALLRALWNGEESGDDHFGEAVEDVLSAFVRRRTLSRLEESRLEPDVQSALSALGARPATLQNRPLDLSGVRLRGVEWPFARLSGAHLMNADLRGALLVGADLRGAWLRGAYLNLANLDGANLCGADLRGAIGWDAAQLLGVRSDEHTRWPVAPLWAKKRSS